MASLRSPLRQLVYYDLVLRGDRKPGAGDRHDALAVADARLPAGRFWPGLANCFFFGGTLNASNNSHRPRRAAVRCFPAPACGVPPPAIRDCPQPCQAQFTRPIAAVTSAGTTSWTRSNCWTFWPPQIPTTHSLSHWERVGVREQVPGIRYSGNMSGIISRRRQFRPPLRHRVQNTPSSFRLPPSSFPSPLCTSVALCGDTPSATTPTTPREPGRAAGTTEPI